MTDQQSANFCLQPWHVRAIGLAVGFMLVLGLYLPHLDSTFIFDDWSAIVRKSKNFEGQTLADCFRRSQRPVTDVTFYLGHAVHGLSPAGYRLFNITIHLGSAAMLWFVIRFALRKSEFFSLTERRIEAIAVATAVLWAIHPISLQAVQYITQRYESLSSFFVLLSLTCLALTDGRKLTTAKILLQVAAVGTVGLAICSKQSAVVSLLILLLFDRSFLSDQSYKTALKNRYILYIVGTAVTAVALHLTGVMSLFQTQDVDHLASSDAFRTTAGLSLEGVSPLSYLFSQAFAVTHYAWRTVWPTSLAIDYGFELRDLLSIALPRLIVLVSVFVFAVVSHFRLPRLSFVILTFFFLLAPTSSIVPIDDLVVDHRAYLATSLLLVLLAVFVSRLFSRQPYAPLAIAVLFACLLCFSTWQRQQILSDSLTNWRDIAERYPHNSRAHSSLGIAYFQAGEHDKAIASLLRAHRTRPFEVRLNYNIGEWYFHQKRFAEAAEYYRRALHGQPNSIGLMEKLAESHFRQMNATQAKQYFERIIEAAPDDVNANERLSRIAIHEGQLNLARQYLLAALKNDPCNGNAIFSTTALAQSLIAKDMQKEAAKWVNESIAILKTCPDVSADQLQPLEQLRAQLKSTAQ